MNELTELEHALLQKIRQLVAHGYGECSFKVHNHALRDVKINLSISDSHKKWAEMQQERMTAEKGGTINVGQ
jgi:hypothetical protein